VKKAALALLIVAQAGLLQLALYRVTPRTVDFVSLKYWLLCFMDRREVEAAAWVRRPQASSRREN